MWAKLCVANCMVAIFICAACGGTSSPASTSTRRRVDNAARGGGEQLPAATCVGAKISVGHAAGEVRFAVTCRAHARGGRVGFTVGRQHLVS